jgi:uncharacterized protein (DUF2141 family)
MKNSIILALVISTSTAVAQNSLEIKIHKLQAGGGNVIVGLFANGEEFLSKTSYSKVMPATGTEVVIVFRDLPDGEYAISVIHDQNENGQLDKNFIGIPKEGFAFGNNAMGAFGPPSFEKAKVILKNQNLKHQIAMKYM